MAMARGSWLVLGIVGFGVVLGLIAWIVRPVPVSPLIPSTTQESPDSF